MGGRFFSYAAGSLFAEVLMQRYIYRSEMIVALSSFDRPIGELEVGGVLAWVTRHNIYVGT